MYHSDTLGTNELKYRLSQANNFIQASRGMSAGRQRDDWATSSMSENRPIKWSQPHDSYASRENILETRAGLYSSYMSMIVRFKNLKCPSATLD